MEYSFKSSIHEDKLYLVLGEHSLLIKQGNEKTELPYAVITKVQLIQSKNHFCIKLYFEKGHPLSILNYTLDDEGNKKEQSRTYSIFVRVLHMHLADKSKAIYTSRLKNQKLISIAAAALLGVGVLAMVAVFLGFDFYYAPIAIMVSFIVFAVVYLLNEKIEIPRRYQPNNIPLELLPEN